MGKTGADGSSIPGLLRALAGACARAGAGDWGRILIVGGVVAFVMAVSGGFGAGHLPFAMRLAYCEGLMLAGVGLGHGVVRLVVPRRWFETRPIVAAGLTTALVGLPMTGVSAAAVSLAARAPLDVAMLADVFPTNLAVTAGVVMLAFLVQSRAPVATHTAPAGAPPPRFLARLPPRLAGATLWAVQAEDHYLRVRTTRGEDLILMRLSDALVELEGVEGARTHRSWWVAKAAIAGIERAEGRATLLLPDGTRAPVSRGYLKSLRDAGWL
jgi:hypothetical protein